MLAARASAREQEEEEWGSSAPPPIALLPLLALGEAGACGGGGESSSLSPSLDSSAGTSCFEAAVAACLPPCPSKTPKTWSVAWVEVPVV